MPHHRLPLVLLVPLVLLSACHHPPTQPVVLRPRPAAVREPVVPPGVTISPIQRGDDTRVAFEPQLRAERTFPDNRIGANLAFTSNLRMPKLAAVVVDRDRYQLRMRFSNSTQTPLFVTLDCIYEGETRAARRVHSVEFPVETFRDITFDLEGDPGRKVHIRASAVAEL